MKLVHLSPGAGENFYCENCLRDAAMVVALRSLGHDAACLPMYLPLMTETPLDERARGEVFFGGVNVYLQQKLALFRKTPRWIDRLFDSPRLLRWAGRKAGMTRADDVGETMLSMLRGELGRQVKELERLVTFLVERDRPDIVSISNALLVGLARRIKQALSVPIVCSLQDEEGFVESLPEPYRSQAWNLLAERARDVDLFIAPSAFYRDAMRRRLDLPADRFAVIPNAIDVEAFAPAATPPPRPTIGYLSQMCESKGLDTLVEAFCLLKRSARHERLGLRVAGGMTGADVAFVQRVRRRIADAGLADAVELRDDFDPADKTDWLQACSVVSVPTRRGEAFGLFVLEALACGVPVVLPDHGAFPELVAATGGGTLCRPNDPNDLAEKLDDLLRDPGRAAELGRAGRQAVTKTFHSRRMAEQVTGLCEGLMRPSSPGQDGGRP